MLTFDEYLATFDEQAKADLITGEVYREPPNTLTENRLIGFVSRLIDGYVAAYQIDGIVLTAKYAFKFGPNDGVEPDVAYVTPDRTHLVGDYFADGGPDIAVEIVSRDSVTRDYNEKRELYQSAGVEEYWIVDPRAKRVQFLQLADGQYELAPLEDNRIFRSRVIPGFWLNVDWLLQRPVPPAYDCLQEILAAKPKPSRKRKR